VRVRLPPSASVLYIQSISASVLKNKKAFLTGREKITEILPLDFDEFLNFKSLIDAKKICV